jgi:hypothetical protein
VGHNAETLRNFLRMEIDEKSHIVNRCRLAGFSGGLPFSGNPCYVLLELALAGVSNSYMGWDAVSDYFPSVLARIRFTVAAIRAARPVAAELSDNAERF